MASKRGRYRRRKNDNGKVILGAFVVIVVAIVVLIIVNNNSNAAGAQIAASPPSPNALDKCGSAACGDANAPVTLDVYADFQCPYCKQFDPVLQQLGPDYIDKGKVKLVYHNFAFIGPESNTAAQAALCAGDQNKFWLFANYLFDHQGAENSGVFTSANLKKMAAVAGLDTAKFNSCLDTGKNAGAVQQQVAEAQQKGVKSTPTFFVNGQIHEGGVSYNELASIINAAMPK